MPAIKFNQTEEKTTVQNKVINKCSEPIGWFWLKQVLEWLLISIDFSTWAPYGTTTEIHYNFCLIIFHYFLCQNYSHYTIEYNESTAIYLKNIFFKTNFFSSFNFQRSIKVNRFLYKVAENDRRQNDNSIKLISYKIIVIPFDSEEVSFSFFYQFWFLYFT